MSLIRKKPWTRQPQVAVGVDWGNPITSGLIGLVYTGQGRSYDLVSGLAATNTGVTRGPRRNGVASTVATAGTNGVAYPRSNVAGAAKNWETPSASVSLAMFGTWAVGGATVHVAGITNGYQLLDSFATGGRTVKVATSVSAYSTSVGTWTQAECVRGLTYDGANLVGYENGVSFGSSAATGTLVYDATFGRLQMFGSSDYSSVAGSGYWMAAWNRPLSAAEHASLNANPWQLFAPLVQRQLVAAASGAVTHATSGALTGAASTLAGTAAHIAIHSSTGALAGAGGALSGTAARLHAFSSTGALAGAGATLAGTAARLRAMATSGALVGDGATVTGAAARAAAGVHATTGALSGAGATLAGTAAHVATHTTTGALVADGATLAGAAATPLKAFFGGGGLWRHKPWWLRTEDDKPDQQPQIEAEIEAMVAQIPAVARQNMFTDLVRNAKRARDNGAPLEDAFAAQRTRTKTRQRRDEEMLLLMD